MNNHLRETDKPPDALSHQLLLYRAQHLPAYQRLVVLVAEDDLSESVLAQHIALIAAPKHTVILLAMSGDIFELPRIQLRLTFIQQLLAGQQINVTTHLASQPTWVQAIRQYYQPGDLVVCLNTHQVEIGHTSQPMSTFVANVLRIPTYVIPTQSMSLQSSARKTYPRWLVNAIMITSLVSGAWGLGEVEVLTAQWPYLAHITVMGAASLFMLMFIFGLHFYID